MRSRRIFSKEYKRECVELVLHHGYTVANAAKTMDVGLSSITRWLRQYRQELKGITPVGAKALTEEQQRIQQLEAQVRRLEREKDLLKKASAFFAMEMHSDTKSPRS